MSDFEPLAWLEPILVRRREDGSFYYSNQELARFIPVFLLSLGVDPRTLPPQLAAVVAQFAEDAGVEPGMSREQASAAMQAHLQKQPLDPELVFELRRGLREEKSGESIEERGKDVARALGTLVAHHRGLLEPPPQGTVRGGPLARLGLEPVREKKSPKKKRR